MADPAEVVAIAKTSTAGPPKKQLMWQRELKKKNNATAAAAKEVKKFLFLQCGLRVIPAESGRLHTSDVRPGVAVEGLLESSLVQKVTDKANGAAER